MLALALSAALLTGLAAAAPAPSPTNDIVAAAVPTLVDGWYFVRAVVEPNFHSYLQAESQPTATPAPSAADEADAILDVPESAGQFNIVDGQLVFNTAASSPSSEVEAAAEGELYMHVEQSSETPVPRKLRTWFSAEKNDYGEFVFQGDTVTWRVDGLQRPNEAAWLVCEGQRLFVNTGAYGYETPEGCADQTIHSYGGATPDV